MDGLCLQDVYAPDSVCFGCGPKNPAGLRVRSFALDAATCVCHWRPAPTHLAFAGVLNGGICGAVLDCHSNWTAAWHLMHRVPSTQDGGLDVLPCTVTAEFAVRLQRPTPMDVELTVHASVIAAADDRATVDARIEANGKVTATCRGVFVSVKKGHPAFHRW